MLKYNGKLSCASREFDRQRDRRNKQETLLFSPIFFFCSAFLLYCKELAGRMHSEEAAAGNENGTASSSMNRQLPRFLQGCGP